MHQTIQIVQGQSKDQFVLETCLIYMTLLNRYMTMSIVVCACLQLMNQVVLRRLFGKTVGRKP